MKTICQALIDAVHYPISIGYVENVLIERGFDESAPYSKDVAGSKGYKGALADCLYSLIQAVNFSESDKSVGNLTDNQRRLVLKRVNALYGEIGEPLVDEGKPEVECLYL